MPRRGVHPFFSQEKLQSVRFKTLEHYLPVTLINDHSCPCVQILASFFTTFVITKYTAPTMTRAIA